MSRRWLIGWIASGMIVLGALVVASVGSPVELLRSPPAGPQPTLPGGVPVPPSLTATSPATPAGVADPAGAPAAMLGSLVEALAVAVAVLGSAVVVGLVVSRSRRPRLVEHPDAGPVDPEVPEDLLESAARRLVLLRDGEPRNAIVAAWSSLETSAAATGLTRDPAETSSEYTTRVLHTWDVDPRSLGDLAALYREARFSRHRLGEEHRRRAMRDLTTVHDDLRHAAELAHAVNPGDAAGRSGAPDVPLEAARGDR